MIINLLSKLGVKLKTKGTICSEDITVVPVLQNKKVTENGVVTSDEGYAGLGSVEVSVAEPTGTVTLTSNGTYDVKTYEKATVNVRMASGSASIVANGVYDVTDVAEVVVDVPGEVLAEYDGTVAITGG